MGRRGGSSAYRERWGFVGILEKGALIANRRDPLLSCGPFLKDELLAVVDPHIRVTEQAL
jgi:hypothetical protein